MDEFQAVGHLFEHSARVLAAVARGERQVLGGAVTIRAHQRPLVIDEREAFGRVETGAEVRRQRAQQFRRIGSPVVPLRAGVREHPRRARRGA